MRTLTLLFSFMTAFPFVLSAQSAGELLQKVSAALSEEQDDYAVSLFRQSIDAEADQAEMFYWTHIEKSSPVAPHLINELATYYKRKRNYDKAYLFYREYLQYHSEDIAALVSCAEMEMMRGKEKDAVETYEKVLMHDANNLQANIFLGNYFYLQAEQEKKTLDSNYKRITSPTRMQHARYRNSLSAVYSNSYSKAKDYLQRVLQLFPSTEAGNILEKIKKLETEMK
ncbi:tetratricopeptide repeat protein [Bacteroides sp. UBA939]|uniref:tetratricopeptide repeat protein n=1 Tax=Bacteroides sp. UBA939 TaxID=1946092 RepID=UPI0025C13681|nr:hypothetical protein [Bacteroides sp. UBA939]